MLSDTSSKPKKTIIRLQDIVKRGHTWCALVDGKFQRLQAGNYLETCPGCGSGSIKWSGIRNKRRSDTVGTLRCNRQGRGRCDHVDACRRSVTRTQNRAKSAGSSSKIRNQKKINDSDLKQSLSMKPMKRKAPNRSTGESTKKVMRKHEYQAGSSTIQNLAAAALKLSKSTKKEGNCPSTSTNKGYQTYESLQRPKSNDGNQPLETLHLLLNFAASAYQEAGTVSRNLGLLPHANCNVVPSSYRSPASDEIHDVASSLVFQNTVLRNRLYESQLLLEHQRRLVERQQKCTEFFLRHEERLRRDSGIFDKEANFPSLEKLLDPTRHKVERNPQAPWSPSSKNDVVANSFPSPAIKATPLIRITNPQVPCL